ncbi:MAG TPA: hypothetical protein VKY85_05420 [Candidatus Angelobacter sp.]|nr:hypothetical protein [Candidatus Angelobacter sp.]
MSIRREQNAPAIELQRLLARLDSDEGRAWQEYEKLRQKLVMFFEPRLEASELAEEVLDRIACKADSYEIINVVEFAFGVARNLRKESFHGSSTLVHLVGDEHLIAGCGNPETDFFDASDFARKRECFSYCLQQLSPEDRQLILEYYPPDDKDLEQRRRRLAAETGLNWGTLRTRMVRLRNRLAECCTRCYRQGLHNSKSGRRSQEQS